jgi:hypothetical protein
MKQPKYQIGDRVGVWKVIATEYSFDWQDWIYCLERGKNGKKLRCSQPMLDLIASKFCSTNPLT